MIRVFVRAGLLGDHVERFDLPAAAGISPRDLLDRFAEGLAKSVPIGVAVDGELLEDQKLDVELRDGQQVMLLPQTADIATIVVLVLINVAVSMAVNYVAGLLSPRPKPPGLAQDRGDDASQTYAWDGIKTNYGPGLPIPWGYGRHALGGQVIATDVQASRASAQAAVDDRLRLLLSLCDGPIYRFGDRLAASVDGLGGFAGGTPGPAMLSELRINGTLVDGNDPLPGVMAWIRPGTQDQPPVPSPFNGVKQTFSIGASLNRTGQPTGIGEEFIYTFEGIDEISELGFVFAFPAGLYQQSQTGALSGLGASFHVSWRPQGTGAWIPAGFANVPIQALPISGLHVLTYRVAVSTTGPIEIRVQRGQPSSLPAGVSYVDSAVWRDLVVASPHVLRYPGEAILGLEIAAGSRFAGGLPQISLRCDLSLVRVWDATNGWSPRCWDVPAAPFNFNTHPPGRNPAWCLLDFLLADHGLGRWLRQDKIDLPAFRRWAAMCDSDPDQVTPWNEPMFTVDVVGDEPRPAWDWVLLFCAAGRATPVWLDGKLSIVYQYRDAHGDAGITIPAKEPVQLLTSGNCENVKVSWLPKKNRATVYEFQFLNEAKAYAQDVLPVEDAESTFNDPTALNRDQARVETIQAFGVTRESQLFREGVWRHRIQRLAERELTGTTGPWALGAQTGDLFDFEHELLRPFAADVPLTMQVLVGGTATTTITIDHQPSGSGLQIVVRNPDGQPERANISSYVGLIASDGSGRPIATLTLATPVTVAAGATCVVGKIDKLTETYQLVALTKGKDLKRDFRAIQWTPDAYDPITKDEFLGLLEPADDGVDLDTAVLDEQDLDTLPPAVIGIRVVPEHDGTHRVAFARPATKVGTWARVYVRPADLPGAWLLVGATELDEVHVRGLRVGASYIVSVCLENRRGDVVPPDLGDLLPFTPEEFPPFSPPAITNLRANVVDDHLLLEWIELAQRDLDYFEVRCGSNWAAATVLARVRTARALLQLATAPAGPPLLVAARSTSGIYGRIVSITNPNWTPRNTVQVLNEDDLAPSPAGTHTDTQWNSTDGVIELAAGMLRGTYESLAQDLTTQAPYYWQVRIDREELEDVPVSDLTFKLGSGEGRWRLNTGRPASPCSPGLGWHLRCQDLAGVLCGDLPAHFLARGYLGVVGSHTRVLLESRFHVGGSWTAYAPHVDRVVVARQIQTRLTFGRRALKYRARVRQLTYAAFI